MATAARNDLAAGLADFAAGFADLATELAGLDAGCAIVLT